VGSVVESTELVNRQKITTEPNTKNPKAKKIGYIGLVQLRYLVSVYFFTTPCKVAEICSYFLLHFVLAIIQCCSGVKYSSMTYCDIGVA